MFDSMILCFRRESNVPEKEREREKKKNNNLSFCIIFFSIIFMAFEKKRKKNLYKKKTTTRNVSENGGVCNAFIYLFMYLCLSIYSIFVI